MRHNTPGLFGEVVLAAPPATWVLLLICLAGLAVAGALLFGLTIDGLPLARWLFAR